MQQMHITGHLQNVKEQLQISESPSRIRPKMFLVPSPQMHTHSCVHTLQEVGITRAPHFQQGQPLIMQLSFGEVGAPALGTTCGCPHW